MIKMSELIKEGNMHVDCRDISSLEKLYNFIKKRHDIIVNERNERLEEIVEFSYKDSYIKGLDLEELSSKYDLFGRLYKYYLYLKVSACLKISKKVNNYYTNKRNLVYKKEILTLKQVKDFIRRIQEYEHSNNELEQNCREKLKDTDNLVNETMEIINSAISRKIK